MHRPKHETIQPPSIPISCISNYRQQVALHMKLTIQPPSIPVTCISKYRQQVALQSTSCQRIYMYFLKLCTEIILKKSSLDSK